MAALVVVVSTEGAVQEHRSRPVGGELHGGVRDVQQLGGHVALPEPRDPLARYDVPHRPQRALVGGRASGVVIASVR